MKKWALSVVFLGLIAAITYYVFPEKSLPTNKKITRLVVSKSKRVLKVYSADEVIKTYGISLGKNSTGDKVMRGDYRTPEGTYIINDKNPGSSCHKNLGISYPNAADRLKAKAANLNPGGDIKIHGMLNSWGFIGKFHRLIDWTAGCVAVTDDEVDELYDHVEIGTPIIIEP